MRKIFYLICFIVLLLKNDCESAEILAVFPAPSYSHQSVFQAVTAGLVAKGHKITLMTTYPHENERNHENITLVDWSFVVEDFHKVIDSLMSEKGLKNSIFRVIDMQTAMVDDQLSVPKVHQMLKNKNQKFDLLLIEASGFASMHAFAEHYKIPVVGITSADALSAGHEVMGNVFNPVAHPDRIIPLLRTRRFLERVSSVFFTLFFKYILEPKAVANYQQVTEKHFPNVKKTYKELVGNVELLLVNAHPSLGYLRPVVANTIQLGFLHIKPPKELPTDLLKRLDDSKNGVIYMSLGTLVKSSFLKKNIEIFVDVFRELEYDIIWKFEDEQIENKPNNVYTNKWFPQSDLLAHPKVKLFITQGGQQSLEESIDRNVPLLVCPIHGDQQSNGARVVMKNIGKVIDLKKIDRESLKAAIIEVISNESYKKNIKELSIIIKDVPSTSQEKAVWWIEHVIRNKGAKHLIYEQKDIPFYQYHYFDIIATVLSILFLIILLMVYALKLIVTMIRKIVKAMIIKPKKE
ncbi:unnamed protein product [Diamesa tonsa]